MDACCVSAVQAAQAKTRQRTAKSCGPGAATLASIRPARAGTATVATKAVHRGEHEVSRQTIARGKPGCLGCTCQTRVHSFTTQSHTVLRAQSAPGFPCALFEKGGQRDCTTRAKSCRGNAYTRLRAVLPCARNILMIQRRSH